MSRWQPVQSWQPWPLRVPFQALCLLLVAYELGTALQLSNPALTVTLYSEMPLALLPASMASRLPEEPFAGGLAYSATLCHFC